MGRTITISVTDQDYVFLKKKSPSKTLRRALHWYRDIQKHSDVDLGLEEQGSVWKFIDNLKNKIFFLQKEIESRNERLDVLREEVKDVWLEEEITTRKRRVHKTSKADHRTGDPNREAGGSLHVIERDRKQKALF